jgi:hypothetical protein
MFQLIGKGYNLRRSRAAEEEMHGVEKPWWTVPAIVATAMVFCGGLGWVILQGYRWLNRQAQAAHARAFDGLKVHKEAAPGFVYVRFHTHYGFITFVRTTEHRFWAAPDDARVALRRLHHFNLVWGFFAHGAILIPIVSYVNFLMQRRSVRSQEAAMLI